MQPNFVKLKLEFVDDGRVCVVWLNDPDKLNALGLEMATELDRAADHLARRDQLRCVVLTGVGRAFSAGGNLAELMRRRQQTSEVNRREMHAFYDSVLSLRRRLCVPLLAAVDGPAVGAGLALALSADVRLASPRARFGATFCRLGLHPGAGALELMRRDAGLQATALAVLTGATLSAAQAHAAHLVAEICDDPVERAVALARQIGAETSPLAVRLTVATLRHMSDQPTLDEAVLRDVIAQSGCWSSPDLIEGLEAARQHRRPQFAARL